LVNHINPKARVVREILEQNDLSITDEQWQRLETWVDRLVEINSRINLISRKQTEVVWLHHILHSITPLVLIDFPKDIELCDFGTGGGLPGVPLAILRPDWQVFLLDSRQKKISAIKETTDGLGCVNLNFIVGRGEEVGLDPMYNSRFQWLTARAVSAIGNLERWTRDLRKKEATLIAFKGGSLENEEVTPNQLQNVASLIEHPIKLNGYSDFYFGEKKLVEIKFR
jgi:16S rRNA (guanine527-N7)-methyltransferase